MSQHINLFAFGMAKTQSFGNPGCNRVEMVKLNLDYKCLSNLNFSNAWLITGILLLQLIQGEQLRVAST